MCPHAKCGGMESFMKNQDLAKAILDHIGKEENIKNLTHCVTRLRFTLKDRKKADVKYIEQLEGVLGVQEQNGQFQDWLSVSVSSVHRHKKQPCLPHIPKSKAPHLE